MRGCVEEPIRVLHVDIDYSRVAIHLLLSCLVSYKLLSEFVLKTDSSMARHIRDVDAMMAYIVQASSGE